MDLTPEQIAVNEALAVKETQAAELKTQSKAEALRELSKDLGINAFEPKELKAKFNEFTQWQTDQKSEQEILQEKYDLLNGEKTSWQSKELEYESKLKASELGIPQDKLEDALKLAGGKVENLAEVLKKYPVFKSIEGINIGLQNPNDSSTPNVDTELQAYMAANPKIYGERKK